MKINKPVYVVQELNVFNSVIHHCWGSTIRQVEMYAEKNEPLLHKLIKGYADEQDDGKETVQGVCFSNVGHTANIIIWVHKPPIEDPCTFIHECSHAVFAIMDHWSIPMDESTNEIIAMLQESIAGHVLRKEIRDTIKTIT